MLLIVGCLISGLMAYLAHQEIPGSSEYRAEAPRARRAGAGDGLGRGTDSDYGGHRSGAQDRRRYYANGSGRTGNDFRDAPDNGFDAWARAQGFHWTDWAGMEPPGAGSRAAPPPPPPPREPHWSEVLGVSRQAGAGEIRKAYTRIMRGLHPDIVEQTPLTSQLCAEATAAYDKGKRDAVANGRA